MCLRHAHTYESYLLFCLMGGKLFRLYKNCNMESNFFFWKRAVSVLLSAVLFSVSTLRYVRNTGIIVIHD
jgi:hypothetical protein